MGDTKYLKNISVQKKYLMCLTFRPLQMRVQLPTLRLHHVRTCELNVIIVII